MAKRFGGGKTEAPKKKNIFQKIRANNFLKKALLLN